MMPNWNAFNLLFKSKPSGFQKLPWHIVEQIIAYIQAMHLASLNCKVPVDDTTYLKPLFHVCQNWRSVAQKIACRQCFIVCNPLHSELYVDISNWPLFVQQPNPVNYEYVSKVVIATDSWSIYNGEFLESFHQSNYKDAVFSTAYNLQIIFRTNNRKLNQDADIYKNADEFIRFIKKMMPNVITVEIDNSCKYIKNDDMTCILGNELMKGLLNIGSRKILDHKIAYSQVAVYPQPIIGLTSITCAWDENCDIIKELIHSNSKNLKQLSVSSNIVVVIEDLLLDEPDKFITYPQLAELKIEKCTPANFIEEASNDYMPFPSLKLLDISSYDEFPDSLLQITIKHLECLKIKLTDNDAQGLLMSKVVSDKCANLKHVELSSNERRLENFSDCTPAIIDLAIALGINAKSLALIGFRIAKRTLLENLVGVRMKSIRVLDLCAFNVEFDTLLAVLKAFTNLQHLRCNCICLGNNYEGKRLIDLLNDMVAAYHPFNTNLAFITAKCLYYIDKSSVAKGALVTALLCRKLKKIIVDKGKMEMYNDAVKMLLEENDLEKHLAPSISFPLFFA